MRSRARLEKRLLQEQETIGALRAERLEQGKLGAQSNLEVVRTQEKQRERKLESERDRSEGNAQPRRTARPGKPLKR